LRIQSFAEYAQTIEKRLRRYRFRQTSREANCNIYALTEFAARLDFRQRSVENVVLRRRRLEHEKAYIVRRARSCTGFSVELRKGRVDDSEALL